jgi:hypothetical protein
MLEFEKFNIKVRLDGKSEGKPEVKLKENARNIHSNSDDIEEISRNSL